VAGNFRNISLLIVCSVQINSSFAFFLLDKSNLVNYVPNNDDFVCLNLVSSWHCILQVCMFKDIDLTHKVSSISMTARYCSIYYLVVCVPTNPTNEDL
jgi:hypothetical protein